MTTKKELAAKALAQGEDRFTALCGTHGETLHYTKGHHACVQCCSERSQQAHARRVATPEGRAARSKYQRERRKIPEVRDATNEYQRRYNADRKAIDPAFLGATRERVMANQWRKATGAKTMPAAYALEQAAIRQVYAECPKGHHVDHRVPKQAVDCAGNLVAIGLHCIANLQTIPQSLNLRKASFFDPDNFRDQRPANAFPGGAWDPALTEREWSHIELLVRRYGEDRDTCVRVVQEQVANQHRAFLTAVGE